MNTENLFENKRRLRRESIDRLVYAASTRGEPTDRFYWTLVYDLEHAPLTTNLSQLEEVGFVPQPSFDLTDDELPTAMWDLVEALAKIGIYLMHTDHLTDRQLYDRLLGHILLEPVRDLPPDAGAHEFIDLVGGCGIVEEEIYYQYYATDEQRESWRAATGVEFARCTPAAARDHALPRPADESSPRL